MRAAAVVEMIPPKDVPKYMSYSKENQNYTNQITKMQGEMRKIKAAIADVKQNMAYSVIIKQSITQNTYYTIIKHFLDETATCGSP